MGQPTVYFGGGGGFIAKKLKLSTWGRGSKFPEKSLRSLWMAPKIGVYYFHWWGKRYPENCCNLFILCWMRLVSMGSWERESSGVKKMVSICSLPLIGILLVTIFLFSVLLSLGNPLTQKNGGGDGRKRRCWAHFAAWEYFLWTIPKSRRKFWPMKIWSSRERMGTTWGAYVVEHQLCILRDPCSTPEDTLKISLKGKGLPQLRTIEAVP